MLHDWKMTDGTVNDLLVYKQTEMAKCGTHGSLEGPVSLKYSRCKRTNRLQLKFFSARQHIAYA